MKTYGILPMAGKGVRLQPIGFSKELYPIVYNNKHYAISEYSVKSMDKAKVDEIKLIINPEKLDIAKYYSKYRNGLISMYFYDSPSLPESCLYPIGGLNDDDICLFGLPDTLFAPNNSYALLKKELLSGVNICLGLFKVKDASKYDSVSLVGKKVTRVLVKKTPPLSPWIWGIWGADVMTLKKLKTIIDQQKTKTGEKLLGEGMNELAMDKSIKFSGVRLSDKYFDIGSMDAIVQISNIMKDFRM